VVEVESLCRHYGDTAAVDNLNFSIGTGEIVGLLGHNGAGKTTLMRMLCGYLEPSAGKITVDGIDVIKDPRAMQQHLGYLPENLPLYPNMTVAEYLEYMTVLKGISAKARLQCMREVIMATDLEQYALAPVHTLSRGSRQRVGVAQALLGQPRLLILDEPTNGLDPGQTWQMRELIQQAASHATVILSTHIMQEVEAVCGRVLLMRGGQLALDQALPELIEKGLENVFREVHKNGQ
jgi:ABC-2 type transport system ATP-binding protein